MKKKWFKERDKSDNLIAITKNFIYQNDIAVTNLTIEKELKSHFQYPGFQSISDTFHNWLIPNKVFRIDSERIHKAVFPAIAYFEGTNSFVLIIAYENNNVRYINSSVGWVTETLDNFNKKWNGVLLMAQKQENSGENNYRENKRLETFNKISKYAFYFIAAVLLTMGMIFNSGTNKNSIYIAQFVAKITGLIGSIILLKVELGNYNSALHRICSLHKNLSCSEVLKSSSAKIFGYYSLAELGILYFLSTLMGLILSPHYFYNETMLILAITSVFACIYSIYLIFYQFHILKKACPFCLLVEFVIIIEFLLSISYISDNSVSIKFFYPLAYMFGIVITLFFFIHKLKSSVILNKRNTYLEKEINFFAQNPKVLQTYFEEHKEVIMTLSSHEFAINKNQSENNLIFILSLKCKYCKDALREIQKILYASIDTQIYLMFIFKSDEERDILEKIISYYIDGSIDTAMESLFYWYSMKQNKQKILNWNIKYQIQVSAHAKDIVQENINWIAKNRIFGTPSIIFNNRILPQNLNRFMFNYLKAHYSN